MAAMSDTLVRPKTDGPDTDDPGRLAHYIRKDLLADAYVLGMEVEALCGYRWIPSRDPERYPICAPCAALRAAGMTFG